MVVDDEVSVLDQIKSFLDDEYQVITVENSRQALEMMNEKDIDMILIDTMMPASMDNGFFCMSPSSRFDVEEQGNFISKPFTKNQLVDFLNKKIKH